MNEMQLWQEVAYRALQDALKGDTAAKEWFDHTDFFLVCGLAQIDPQSLLLTLANKRKNI